MNELLLAGLPLLMSKSGETFKSCLINGTSTRVRSFEKFASRAVRGFGLGAVAILRMQELGSRDAISRSYAQALMRCSARTTTLRIWNSGSPANRYTTVVPSDPPQHPRSHIARSLNVRSSVRSATSQINTQHYPGSRATIVKSLGRLDSDSCVVYDEKDVRQG